MAHEAGAVLELLQCGLCNESMIPPIFQCRDGHTICDDCQKKCTACPVCRNGVIDIRCRALERLAESRGQVPCTFSKYGCSSVVEYLQHKDHEGKCTYRPFPCLNVRCQFEGGAEEMVKHLVAEHNYELHETNVINFTCSSSNYTLKESSPTSPDDPACDEWVWQNHIYSCHDKYYVLRIHRRAEYDPQFYISICSLHGRHHANRYSISTFGNHRKYTFEGPVWSIRKGFKEVERVRDCLILPENIALFLSGGKGSENDLSGIELKISGVISPPSSANRNHAQHQIALDVANENKKMDSGERMISANNRTMSQNNGGVYGMETRTSNNMGATASKIQASVEKTNKIHNNTSSTYA